MNRSLRKRHQWTWIFVALLLPAIAVYGLMSAPAFATEQVADPTSVAAIGQVLNSYEDDVVKLNFRGTSTTATQLELILKIPPKSAQTLVYYTKDGQAEQQSELLVGTIGRRGVYRFDFPQGVDGLYWFDPIKNEPISTINF